ncbi:hypothetical protein BaRGS_00029313, partial [Batillaria attramentaria]
MARQKPAPLPVLEQTLYWVFGLTATSYSFYSVYRFSQSQEVRGLPYIKTQLNATHGPSQVLGPWRVFGNRKVGSNPQQPTYNIPPASTTSEQSRSGPQAATIGSVPATLGKRSRLSAALCRVSNKWTDTGDDEWYVYSSVLLWRMIPGFALHVALSQAIRVFNIQGTTRKLLLLSCGAVATSHVLSWRYLVLTMLSPCLMFLVTTLRSVPAVWFVCMGTIAALNGSYSSLANVLQIDTYDDYFLFVYEYTLTVTRTIAFGLERVWSLRHAEHQATCRASATSSPQLSPLSSSQSSPLSSSQSSPVSSSGGEKCPVTSHRPESRESSAGEVNGKTRAPYSALYGWPVLPKVPGILDGLVYVCYVPFLFSGPPMPFYQFLTEMESPRKLTGRRLADITWCFLRIVFWFFFNHAMLHLVFFSTLAQTPPLFQAMDRWTLLGTAWLLGQFMTNKYFVICGLPSQIARLDGLEPATFPACISYIYKYSDMWRSFDRGLYQYLRRYIFIPVGGSRSGFLRAQLSFALTFAFIGFWHGGEPNLQAWAVLNFVEVNLEKLGAVLEKWSVVQDLLLKRLSPQADARLRGALCVILFYVGTTSNMFFLGGSAFAMHYAI